MAFLLAFALPFLLYAAAIAALMEIVFATGSTVFFWPCPSLLTDSTLTRPGSDNLDTSRDTVLGLRCEAS